MLLISFGFMVYRLETHPSILMLYVIVLIFIIHGTPTLVYGTLRYSWAWKHIGIIDYIERFGTVDPNINVLNAYHNWPGFFTLNAFITQAAGLEDPLRIAMWAPVFFNLIDLGALLLIFTSFTKDKTLIWLAIFIYYLTSWVGQDYYSPQALNYFLHLVILGVALRWARLAVPPSPRKLKRWFRFNWVAIVIYKFLRRSNRGQLLTTDSPPLNRLTIVTIVILLGGTIASSHQITPFMTIMALAALVIFQRIKERSLPIIMIVLTFGWLMFGATAFMRHEVTEIITSFGQITENVDSNLRDTSEASPGQQLVSKMGRGLTLLTWGLAFLGGPPFSVGILGFIHRIAGGGAIYDLGGKFLRRRSHFQGLSFLITFYGIFCRRLTAPSSQAISLISHFYDHYFNLWDLTYRFFVRLFWKRTTILLHTSRG